MNSIKDYTECCNKHCVSLLAVHDTAPSAICFSFVSLRNTKYSFTVAQKAYLLKTRNSGRKKSSD